MDNAPMTAAELEAAIPEERKRILVKSADGEASRILKEAGYEGGAIAGAPDLMNMPRGRVIVGAHPTVTALAGPDLARALMFGQLRADPTSDISRLQSLKTKLKPNSRERRAARIAAGKLRVVDGALVGAA